MLPAQVAKEQQQISLKLVFEGGKYVSPGKHWLYRLVFVSPKQYSMPPAARIDMWDCRVLLGSDVLVSSSWTSSNKWID